MSFHRCIEYKYAFIRLKHMNSNTVYALNSLSKAHLWCLKHAQNMALVGRYKGLWIDYRLTFEQFGSETMAICFRVVKGA